MKMKAHMIYVTPRRHGRRQKETFLEGSWQAPFSHLSEPIEVLESVLCLVTSSSDPQFPPQTLSQGLIETCSPSITNCSPPPIKNDLQFPWTVLINEKPLSTAFPSLPAKAGRNDPIFLVLLRCHSNSFTSLRDLSLQREGEQEYRAAVL